MRSVYKPLMLTSIKAEIRKEHPSSSEMMYYQPDQEFLGQIKRWTELSEKEAEEEAHILPIRKIWLIVNYIPDNSLKLPLHNLAQMIYLRVNRDIARRLFVFWQDYFVNEELCNLLYRTVKDIPDAIHNIVSDNKLDNIILADWFCSKNIPQSVGKVCITLQKKQRIRFADRLMSVGILPSSKLGQCCITEFLTFCDEIDYREISDADMFQTIKKFSPELIVLFLKNILTVLKVEDFQNYFQCGLFLRSSVTSGTDTQKYHQYFSSFTSEQELKYRRWMNYVLVRESFAKDSDDGRLKFWSRYVPYSLKVYRVNISESLVLEFEMYCIIEFPKKANGPLYIYRRDVFQKNVRNNLFSSNNTELKHSLYNELLDLCEERITHHGNWEYKTKQYLIANRVI